MTQKSTVRVTYRQKPTFLEKIGSSFVGSVGGFAVFVISFFVLYSNEGRSVETATLLEEALRIVIPIHGTNQEIAETNNKLVHVAGPLQSQILGDPDYPVAIPCVQLARKVEMYQWVEHSEVKEFTEGNEIRTETHYTYDNEWSSTIHQSRHFAEEFGHQNPSQFDVPELHQISNRVTVASMELSSSAVKQINWFQELVRLPEPLRDTKMKLHGRYYYHAKDPLSPEVGDLRISFQYAGIGGKTKIGPEDEVSVVAMNSGGRLVPYRMRRGRSIEFLHRGLKSPREVFYTEQQANTALTWMLRFGGWVLMFVGLSLMTKIIKTLVGWIPLVGSIVSASVTMFNLTLSLSLSLVTIAVGWFSARPLLSATVGAIAIIPWYLSRMRAESIHSYYSR